MSMFSLFDSAGKVLKKGPASRVIFFYAGEEGTYVDNVYVTLYENGIVHIESKNEETSTHLQNCEVLWRYEVQPEDRVSKLRLLKDRQEGKAESRREENAPEQQPEA